jgi:adenosylmethionine---8-amino-7-oxononanoate aminotransferase
MRKTMTRDEVVHRDKRHVWHPYTAMDAYIETVDPLVIARARGSSLFDANGKRYLDGNSSWWVAALGHSHPRLLRVLREQAETLAHCALAGITHEPAARLAEELCAVAPPGLSHVFYTDNGSTSNEVALKMAIQMWQQLGHPKKSRFVALDGAFHGDTLGATALGGVDVFRRPFAGVVLDCVHAPVASENAYEQAFDGIATLVREQHETLAAVFVEPVVQGAAGMRIYATDYLCELRALCSRHDVLLIVDEVFTGYGRTGPMWACEHAGIAPDILTLGKAFASILPMGATLTTDRVFDAFRGDASAALYYGHTFCGHPLGAALAREVLAIYRDENVLGQVAAKAPTITRALSRIEGTRGVARVRSLGMIGAVDLSEPGAGGGYLGTLGWRVYREALARGAYLRPLGDTVYVCPPLVIEPSELDELLEIFDASIRAALTTT